MCVFLLFLSEFTHVVNSCHAFMLVILKELDFHEFHEKSGENDQKDNTYAIAQLSAHL